jgi:hypothetical protein
MGTYIPPGWPAGVHPPGSEDFESTAVGWLLDVVPPDYRLHGVLRRYPVALATMARYHSKACVEGARQGYRTARTELAGTLPPHAIDTVLAAYRKEGARLAATARAVGLVERALRGEVFTPRMDTAVTVEPTMVDQPNAAEVAGADAEGTAVRAGAGATAARAGAGATAARADAVPDKASAGAAAKAARAKAPAGAATVRAEARGNAARAGAGAKAARDEGDEGQRDRRRGAVRQHKGS